MNEITITMKSNISFAAVIGVLVIALALVATPVLADSLNWAGESGKSDVGKSLAYRLHTPVSPPLTINSIIKPAYLGTLASGRPSVDVILSARSNSWVSSDWSSVSLPDSPISLPGPAFDWDTMLTPPTSCGCGGCG